MVPFPYHIQLPSWGVHRQFNWASEGLQYLLILPLPFWPPKAGCWGFFWDILYGPSMVKSPISLPAHWQYKNPLPGIQWPFSHDSSNPMPLFATIAGLSANAEDNGCLYFVISGGDRLSAILARLVSELDKDQSERTCPFSKVGKEKEKSPKPTYMMPLKAGTDSQRLLKPHCELLHRRFTDL